MEVVFVLTFLGLTLFLFRSELWNVVNYDYGDFTQVTILAIYIVLIFLGFLPFQVTSVHFPLGYRGYYFINICFYFIVGLVFAQALKEGRKGFLQELFRVPLVFFVLFSIIVVSTAIFSEKIVGTPSDYNFQHAFRMFAFFISIISLIQYAKRKNTTIEYAKKLFYLIMFFVFLGVFVQVITELAIDTTTMPWEQFYFDKFGYWYGAYYRNVISQFLIQSNSFSWLLAIAFLFATNMFYKNRSVDFRYVLIMLMTLSLIVQLNSQTAYLTILVGLGIIVISKCKWWSLVILCFFGVGVLVFQNSLLESIFNGWTLEQIFAQDFRLSKLFPAAFKGFLTKPFFGFGYVSGEILYITQFGEFYRDSIIEVHNTFLSIAFNTGLFGLVPFVLGVLGLTYRVLQIWSSMHLDLFSTNLVILFCSGMVSTLTLTDVWYKFDDYLLIRMFPLFILLISVQMIANADRK